MKPRKLTALVMAFTIIMSLALTSCSAGKNEEPPAAEPEKQEEQEKDTSGNGGKNALVIYFSASNRVDADTVTKATPVKSGKGATEWFAEKIHAEVGGDIAKITPVKDYPVEYDEVLDFTKKEADNDERPEFAELEVDPESYDVIYIGYPIWWYGVPKIINTFFDKYDFDGKTIIPFNTHEGSSDGGTYEDIERFEPAANVIEGLAIRGEETGSSAAEEEILDWLASAD